MEHEVTRGVVAYPSELSFGALRTRGTGATAGGARLCVRSWDRGSDRPETAGPPQPASWGEGGGVDVGAKTMAWVVSMIQQKAVRVGGGGGGGGDGAEGSVSKRRKDTKAKTKTNTTTTNNNNNNKKKSRRGSSDDGNDGNDGDDDDATHIADASALVGNDCVRCIETWNMCALFPQNVVGLVAGIAVLLHIIGPPSLVGCAVMGVIFLFYCIKVNISVIMIMSDL